MSITFLVEWKTEKEGSREYSKNGKKKLNVFDKKMRKK